MPVKYLTRCIIIVLSMTLTLACLTYEQIVLKPQQPAQDNTTVQSTGTHIWAWNHGEQTCETQDDMTLIIGTETIKVKSEGKCMSIKGLNPFTCYEAQPGDRCIMAVEGTIDEGKVIFRTCSNSDLASGSAVKKNNILSGSAKCGEDTIKFSFPLSEKK